MTMRTPLDQSLNEPLLILLAFAAILYLISTAIQLVIKNNKKENN